LYLEDINEVSRNITDMLIQPSSATRSIKSMMKRNHTALNGKESSEAFRHFIMKF